MSAEQSFNHIERREAVPTYGDSNYDVYGERIVSNLLTMNVHRIVLTCVSLEYLDDLAAL